ncbi:MAG: DUF1707 domain-containing protein [Mycobacteriaceae bacterium]
MVDEPDVRIGTPEREAAQQRLNEHFSLGRLDVAEFEERSTLVSGARTRSDLDGVFHDLPAASDAAHEAAVAKPTGRDWRYTVMGAAPLVAVVLFFLLNGHFDNAWLVFLLIPLSGVVLSAGNDEDRARRRIGRGKS